MNLGDNASVAGLVGAIIGAIKIIERVADHFLDRWRPQEQPQINAMLQLDPEVSRQISGTHEVVTREDQDGAKRLYVPARTNEQMGQIHAVVMKKG